MGFDAVWISPIVKNVEGQSYHGYWAQDINQINPHFGTADDLKALSAELHRRGMYLMVDVAPNHNGPQSSGAVSSDSYYSLYAPFNQKAYYHNYCTISNYNDQNNVEQCWLGSTPSDALPDLNTENSFVTSTYYSWISNLVKSYQIDGLRVDTVKHCPRAWWPGFKSSSGVFNIGEVFSGDPAYVKPYQDAAMDGLLNYPVYYPLQRAFQSTNRGFGEMKQMVNTIRSTYRDPLAMGTFLDNHDNPRFASTVTDKMLVRNAMTYILVGDGIPVLYYGQEQDYSGGQDPYNREALWTSGYNTNTDSYKYIAAVNKLRKFVKNRADKPLTTQLTSLFDNSGSWAFNKGNMLVVLSSAGQNGGTQIVSIGSSSLPAGQMTNVINCATINVNSGGSVTIQLNGGQPAIFYPSSSLGGSGICGK
ncbi:related to alpha-amylase [Pseudozyma flocculosa]|uniref:alpha-amylase n=2 Tax=Pseudozyma flocculosa TaxID=84751 RepID=A0A5C3EU35_9BASI|nr:related to alpha-amylase [Pseudozyma flocculosa]